MNIVEATKSYESWLGKITKLRRSELDRKHQIMRDNKFAFLRATYYRWAQIWVDVCPELARDPSVLAVGDLHVENFGTWRDIEGRLVWGINDFDEAFRLPFTNDLVRLATSAYMAIEEGELSIAPKAASTAILRGYSASLDGGGLPLTLVDTSTPLRDMVRDRLKTPERFWNKMAGFPALREPAPKEIKRMIQDSVPGEMELRYLNRVAGAGSLGKERFTAMGMWCGGYICREAKALTASACEWALNGKKGDGRINYEEILARAVRCPDPMIAVRGSWLLRRLSQDCFKLTLDHLPAKRNETDLLYSMGWETANIHLGSARAKDLAKNLSRKPSRWLHQAAKAMRDETERDWRRWVKG